MKKIQLFFATIFSLFLIAGLTSCGGNSGERQPTDVCFEHKNTIKKKDDQITQLNLSLENCREQDKKPDVISSNNFTYYEYAMADSRKFYKIILTTVISDPIITGGAEGDMGGQTLEFILESVEPDPVRVVGAQFFPYEDGKSSIPASLKVGAQVTLDDMEYQGDIHIGG